MFEKMFGTKKEKITWNDRAGKSRQVFQNTMERMMKVLTVLVMIVLCTMLCEMSVNAAGNAGNVITNAFGVVYQIIAAVVSSIGVLMLLWAMFEWGQSMSIQDGGAQGMAFKRIGGGLVMALGPQLLPLILAAINVVFSTAAATT